ncbi:MAG: ferredoxin [Candidatus Aenigmarchaeota archaeon]|nr:ferredoxin [Candidatus Aenigmarchaeota archaeon]
MGKYKIIYERDACIGAAVCVAIAPTVWELDKENKAVLKGGSSKDKNIFEKEIDEKELQINLDAARGCPVNAIHIIEKDTGKKLI